MKKNVLTLLVILLFLTISVSAKTVSVLDFGAVVDDDVCDTHAIRAAVDDVRTNGGGTIIFPAGVTKLCGQVDFTDFKNYVSYHLTGDKGAEISVSLGSDEVGFEVANINQMNIDHLVFTGANVPDDHPLFIDCRTLFHFSHANSATFKDVQFYGLWCSNSLIDSGNVDLILDSVNFGGSLGLNATIYAKNIRGLSVKNSSFIDYANYKNKYWSKSSRASYSWISVVNDVLPVVDALSAQVVRIENCRFDEGSKTAIILKNLPFAVISGINVNVSSMTDGTGIFANNVESLDVEFSQFGLTSLAQSAVTAVNNSNVFIKGIKFGGGVTLGTWDTTSTIFNERNYQITKRKRNK